MQKQRARNLYLARYMFNGQGGISNKIDAADQTLYDRLERQTQGKAGISAADAERYADRLGLPGDWFDRDNDALLHLNSAEYEAVQAVLRVLRAHSPRSTK